MWLMQQKKNLKNDFELTAIDSAKDNNNTEVVKFLVGYSDEFKSEYLNCIGNLILSYNQKIMMI
jgi:hypothetical protein